MAAATVTAPIASRSVRTGATARPGSTIARGKRARLDVMNGKKKKTAGGLTRDSLMVNKAGKVVSKRASANGKRAYRFIEAWHESVMEARVLLHVHGFVAINGESLLGKALYVKAKSIYAERKRVQSEASTQADEETIAQARSETDSDSSWEQCGEAGTLAAQEATLGCGGAI